MSNDINVTDGVILETLNHKIDYDGGNYIGSGLEAIIKKNGGAGGLEIGDIGFTQMAIDETKGKRRALNKVDNIIIQEQYPVLTQRIKKTMDLYPEYFCTEAEWQTELTMSVNGVCDKFVIDDNAGTIRLPKYPEYLDLSINGTKTVAVYGTGMTLGLTNGSENAGLGQSYYGSYRYAMIYPGGYGKPVGSDGGDVTQVLDQTYGITKDSTKSGITGSVTTSSEKIKGTYFIQVATGAETEDNITNEIELNNPFSLLDYKYSEYELNNLSWLRSNGQYNSKAVYPAVYDLLLKIYNGTETKAGVSVKLTTETFTDYDFVLNTAEEIFRLPVKVKQKFLNAINGNMPVVGNGMALGLTNGTNNCGLARVSQNGTYLLASPNAYGANVSSTASFSVDTLKSGIFGVTTEPTKSGIVAKITQSEVTGLYLYFYVGETVQNANLINAGRIEEKLVDLKVDIQNLIPNNSENIAHYAFPADKNVSLTLGASGASYTAPANGWICLSKKSTGANQYLQLYNSSISVQTRSHASANNVIAYLPLRKGDQFWVTYDLGGDTSYFRFTYAQGDV